MRHILAALVCVMTALPVWAEQHSDCPDELRAEGVPEGATPNVRTRFIAPPRLVGGDVRCLLVAVDGGFSRFVTEVLPGQSGRYLMIHGHLSVALRDVFTGAPGGDTLLRAPSREVARCARPVGEDLLCSVDLGSLRLVYDDALDLVALTSASGYLRLEVPGQGVAIEVPESDQTDRNTLAMFAQALGDGRYGLRAIPADGARSINWSPAALEPDLRMARRFFTILLPEILPPRGP